MSAPTVTENQVFTFTSESTIGDLLLVANALKAAGQVPKLRFVRSYLGLIESVAVDVEGTAPSEPVIALGEMAIYDSLSDPRD